MDCEGCEWETLHQIYTETPHILENVSLLIIEIHLTYRLSHIPLLKQLEYMYSFWNYYIKILNFKIFYVSEIVGWEMFPRNYNNPIVDMLVDVFHFSPGVCCYEIGLYREL
jgi:hypothetical protein